MYNGLSFESLLHQTRRKDPLVCKGLMKHLPIKVSKTMTNFLNDIVNDVESTQKIDNYVKMTSLKSEPTCKLINRIPGLHLLISNLPGLSLRMHVESLSKPRDVNKCSQSLPW